MFWQASASEAFWLRLEPRALQGYLQDFLSRGQPYRPACPS
ncbi:hypothetical protein [Paludibacterium denitrificans]|nr:hypothetical protein [Paludibacterium denitrificans]